MPQKISLSTLRYVFTTLLKRKFVLKEISHEVEQATNKSIKSAQSTKALFFFGESRARYFGPLWSDVLDQVVEQIIQDRMAEARSRINPTNS